MRPDEGFDEPHVYQGFSISDAVNLVGKPGAVATHLVKFANGFEITSDDRLVVYSVSVGPLPAMLQGLVGDTWHVVGRLNPNSSTDKLGLVGGGIRGFRVTFEQPEGAERYVRFNAERLFEPGGVSEAYKAPDMLSGTVRIGYEVHGTRQRKPIPERVWMSSPTYEEAMALRIDERHRLSRGELHALLRGRPLVWNGKSSTGGSHFEAKLAIELAPEINQKERTAALDALTNDLPQMYKGGWAVNKMGHAYPVPGTTAWLAYVASNADRILWNGRPLAEHDAAEQRRAIEAWLLNEQVPPIMAATHAYLCPVPEENRKEMVPVYGNGEAKPSRIDARAITGAWHGIDEDMKLSAEAEASVASLDAPTSMSVGPAPDNAAGVGATIKAAFRAVGGGTLSGDPDVDAVLHSLAASGPAHAGLPEGYKRLADGTIVSDDDE